MKKVLHMVRHAKSSWEVDGIADIDRSLKPKGIRHAYEIARRLKLNHLVPERILSSPADRALHTAIIFARIFELPLHCLQVSEALYDSSAREIIELVKSADDQIQSLMLFGHNPDFTDVVNHFVHSPVEVVPTSGAVSMIFQTDKWKEISASKLQSSYFNFPAKEE